jgi:hypothetical protein
MKPISMAPPGIANPASLEADSPQLESDQWFAYKVAQHGLTLCAWWCMPGSP